jgi:hypothetical protein
MNGLVWEHCALNNQIFLRGKVYYSNFNITILMWTLIANCRVENILSPLFLCKIS